MNTGLINLTNVRGESTGDRKELPFVVSVPCLLLDVWSTKQVGSTASKHTQKNKVL